MHKRSLFFYSNDRPTPRSHLGGETPRRKDQPSHSNPESHKAPRRFQGSSISPKYATVDKPSRTNFNRKKDAPPKMGKKKKTFPFHESATSVVDPHNRAKAPGKKKKKERKDGFTLTTSTPHTIR
jgi:hypothetical protein